MHYGFSNLDSFAAEYSEVSHTAGFFCIACFKFSTSLCITLHTSLLPNANLATATYRVYHLMLPGFLPRVKSTLLYLPQPWTSLAEVLVINKARKKERLLPKTYPLQSFAAFSLVFPYTAGCGGLEEVKTVGYQCIWTSADDTSDGHRNF